MNNRRPSQTEEKSDESGDEPLGDEIQAIAEEEEDEVGFCSVFQYNLIVSTVNGKLSGDSSVKLGI